MYPSQKIHNQYLKWPYPSIPLFGSVRRTDTWQINIHYLADRCGVPPPASKPRILIVGCGTFQPYVFALANPDADIIATDISETSLKIAQNRNRLHGIFDVVYQIVDLNDPETYPAGLFDYIECYGVLMHLADPQKTLHTLASKLKDNGILRIMVYPHFSRKRIFQIQRLAKCLGLHSEDTTHPRLLKKVMRSLPVAHPLRTTFTSYRDSDNDVGIVDGFLHAADRSFTGHQVGTLIANAGLKPAFYFHRPWGNPEEMAKELGLPHHSQSFMLHYLDLWQEIRTNFIVCLTKAATSTTNRENPLGSLGIQATPRKEEIIYKKNDIVEAAERSPEPLRIHPLLDHKTGSFRHRLTMRAHRIFGITLPSRTEAHSIHLTGAQLRTRSEASIVLGGATQRLSMIAHGVWLREEMFLNASIEIGSKAVNPFYEGLFKAYTFQQDCVPFGLGTLPEQIKRWQEITDPLEEKGTFGLTPLGTYSRFSKEILRYIEERGKFPAGNRGSVNDFEQVHFKEERLSDVKTFLKQFPLIPKHRLSEGEMRELWILLFSYPTLFLDCSS